MGARDNRGILFFEKSIPRAFFKKVSSEQINKIRADFFPPIFRAAGIYHTPFQPESF